MTVTMMKKQPALRNGKATKMATFLVEQGGTLCTIIRLDWLMLLLICGEMGISSYGFFVLLVFGQILGSSQIMPHGWHSLKPGISFFAEKESDFLVSANGTFSGGFYKVGDNAYCFSIWYSNSANKTVVWMANRENPVNGKKSRLTLTKSGDMVLTDSDGSVVWSSGTVNADVEVQLLETGNMVIIDRKGKFMWQSFDFPTDTILPLQQIVRNTTLVSMRSEGTYFSGYYNLKFDDANVLDLIYNGPALSSIYWPTPGLSVFDNGRSPYNSSKTAVFSQTGRFVSSDNLNFNASDYGIGPKRRLTLDYDGILRLYSLDESNGNWQISWSPDNLPACLVRGLCGENGVCVYNPLPTCICPAGFARNDPSDWTKGCKPLFNLTCKSNDWDFIELPGTDYYGYDLITFTVGVSLETCRNLCLNDCECKGFGYSLDGKGVCYPKGALLNGYRFPNTPRRMLIKVPKAIARSGEEVNRGESDKLNCSSSELVLNSNTKGDKANRNGYMRYLIGFVVAIGVIELIIAGLGWWYVFRKQAHEEFEHMGYIALAMGFKRFTYKELKRATKNFKVKIGEGGFGTVYKGVLDDDRVVAVKRLEGILQGDAEFWAEVSIIGKINHRNLVKMWGFCAENHHKMLVYEFVGNGSLDKILQSPESSQKLGFDQRYDIALGTAKGLSYLHEECLEWVLHCDVKPQNILLDDELQPKVADFGMSKLFRDVNDEGFSRVRGTRGYLAPEWMMNLKIDAKADVYSYGVVLLELLSGKSSLNYLSSASLGSDCTDLVQWTIKTIEKEGIDGVTDPRLSREYNSKKVGRLLKVALLCIGEDRNTRPPMSKVVELLISNDDVP